MYGFEAEGAAAIVKGKVIEQPETVGTAIESAIRPAGKKQKRLGMSPAVIDSVTDEEILSAYKKWHRLKVFL